MTTEQSTTPRTDAAWDGYNHADGSHDAPQSRYETSRTLEMECASLKERTKGLLKAVQFAYRKHHLNDPDIGWDELGDRLCDALCNEMGDEGFHQWLAIAAAEKEGA